MFAPVVMLLVLAQVGPSPIGEVGDAALREVSGIVASRAHAGLFWVHNDSNNPNDLYAIHADGKVIRKVRMPFLNMDWEDIAVDGKGRVYLADTGNNGLRLPLRTIHRIAEPDPACSQPVIKSEACHYRFPDTGRFDCEGVFVVDETVYLVSKRLDGREAEIYTLEFRPSLSLLSADVPRRLTVLPGFTEPATGADLSADGRWLAVCSADVTRVYSFERSGRLTLQGVVRYKKRQVEAIAWDGLDLIITDEPGHLFRIKHRAWSEPGVQGKAEKPSEGRRPR